MAWVKFDDQFDDDEDIDQLSAAAVALYVCCITFSARHLTDGVIPEGRVRRLPFYSSEAVEELCTVGGDKPWLLRVDGGYQIRNFLKYNPCAEKVIAEREAAAARKSQSRGSTRRAASEKYADQTQDQTDHQTEDFTPPVTDDVTASVTPSVTNEVTPNVTEGVTGGVTPPPVSRIPYPNNQKDPLPIGTKPEELPITRRGRGGPRAPDPVPVREILDSGPPDVAIDQEAERRRALFRQQADEDRKRREAEAQGRVSA